MAGVKASKTDYFDEWNVVLPDAIVVEERLSAPIVNDPIEGAASEKELADLHQGLLDTYQTIRPHMVSTLAPSDPTAILSEVKDVIESCAPRSLPNDRLYRVDDPKPKKEPEFRALSAPAGTVVEHVQLVQKGAFEFSDLFTPDPTPPQYAYDFSRLLIALIELAKMHNHGQPVHNQESLERAQEASKQLLFTALRFATGSRPDNIDNMVESEIAEITRHAAQVVKERESPAR